MAKYILKKRERRHTINVLDRGNEVDDEVASAPRSIVYDIAENRLHVQKAIMALTMAKGWK